MVNKIFKETLFCWVVSFSSLAEVTHQLTLSSCEVALDDSFSQYKNDENIEFIKHIGILSKRVSLLAGDNMPDELLELGFTLVNSETYDGFTLVHMSSEHNLPRFSYGVYGGGVLFCGCLSVESRF